MNDKKQRLDELDEQIIYFDHLIAIVKEVVGTENQARLYKDSNFRALCDSQLQRWNEIESILKEAGGYQHIN